MRKLKKIIVTLMIRGGGALLSIIVTFLASRSLAVDEASSFFLFITFVTIVSVNLRWGADEAIIRLASTSEKAHLPMIRSTVDKFANVRLLKSCLLMVPFLIALAFLNERYELISLKPQDLLLGAITAIATAKFSFYARYLHGIGHTEQALIFLSILTPLLFVAGFHIVTPVSWSTEAAAIYMGASLLCLLSAYVVIEKNYPGGGSVDEAAFQGLLQASNHLALVVIAQQIFNWGAQVIVPMVAEPAFYNYFTVSQKTSAAIGLLMVSVNFALSPVYARLYHASELKRLLSLIKLSLVAVVAFSVVVSSIFYALSEEILGLAKVRYEDGGAVFLMLLIAQLLNSVSSFLSVILSMVRQEKYLVRVQVVANALGLTAFAVLAGSMSVAEAVVSMCVTYAVLSALLMVKILAVLK